ncbi:MAG: response regulator [Lachnospiraceae bacterium]|nr:response regulator [Lachnospiraceae bacterium]
MKFLISQILFACFVLALYFSFDFSRKNSWKYIENRLFTIFCLSSAVWSLGFFGVFIQTVPDQAYAWRALGMVGTFGYLITAQLLVCYLSGIPKIYRYVIEGFSYLGIPLYFAVIQKEQVTYQPSDIGMSYSFHPGIWNNLYIAYTVITALNILFVVVYMLRYSPTQRLKVLGKKLLLAEFVIVLGMLFDTILPIIGMTAVPGSSMAQFIGLAVMYHSIVFVNHSRINISNMSEFIYYSLTVPVLVYDSRQKLQILNDTAFSFLGVNKDNFDITGISSLFRSQQEDIFTFEGKSQDVDAVCCHNDLYCSLSINKIYDDYKDIIGYIIIVTDLSEHMKSMKKLEEAIREAEHANQAKSIFLANMSHEIRTPMNVIVGFSELILKMDINDEVRKHVEDIKWSSHNLLATINDILDISKIESGKMELVLDTYFTSGLLNDIFLIISPQAAKKNLAFRTEVDKNIPTSLYGDKIRLRSVLINILNNAVKYTQKGSISFTASVLKQTDKYITLEFKISDTGIGIREKDLQNLFQSFSRLDKKANREIEGTGLGLAIANGYVKLMGGDVKVESTYQKGSTFTVTLDQEIIDATPIGEDYSTKFASLNSSSISDMKIHGLRVLVVDDNPVNLRVAYGILSYYGLITDTASCAADAIRLCRSQNYAFVFMDQMMPGIDGVEAMKEIRTINSHYAPGGACKIIVLTADAIKGTRENLIRKGFDEYLGKPLNIPQLERLFLKYVPNDKITYETSERPNTDISFLKDSLPGIDVESGIKNCGGNIPDYLEILKITYEYGAKQLAELENSWKEKNYEHYIIKIHSMKSTSLNIGATDISNAARMQEEQGRAGNLSYIDEHLQEFQEQYRNLLARLETVLTHYELLSSDAEDTPSEVMDAHMARQVIHHLEHCIEEFNFGKVFEILEETKKYQFSEEYEKLFSQIATLMEDLAIDDINALLKQHHD